MCIVRITVGLPSGDLSTGTGFHIGNGYLVTARHLVDESNTIHEVVGDRGFTEIAVRRIILPDDPTIDLAILETDFSLEHYMTKVFFNPKPSWEKTDIIELGGHLDDWLGDELVLTKAMLVGYPPIPRSNRPVEVAVEVEVNAIIDRYDGPHPYFIVSSIPRGGFSGGPVISEYGFLLGVLIESLFWGGQSQETGFAAVISIEPLLNLVHESKIDCGKNSRFVTWLYESGDPEEFPE